MEIKVGSKVFSYKVEADQIIQYVGKVTDFDDEFVNVEFYGFRNDMAKKFQSVGIVALFKKMDNGHYVNGQMGEAVVVA